MAATNPNSWRGRCEYSQRQELQDESLRQFIEELEDAQARSETTGRSQRIDETEAVEAGGSARTGGSETFRIEDQFRAQTGYGFDALTESEARHLAGYRPSTAIRDRIIAGAFQDRNAGDGEAAEKAVTPAADAGPSQSRRAADGIPPKFWARFKVPHDVYIVDEDTYETIDVQADQALAQSATMHSHYWELCAAIAHELAKCGLDGKTRWTDLAERSDRRLKTKYFEIHRLPRIAKVQLCFPEF